MTAEPEKKPADGEAPPPADAPAAPAKKAEPDPDDDLSDEDRALKDKLDLLTERAMEPDVGAQKLALEMIRSEIRSATSSMTSVPKPLKFLRPHFAPLKVYYARSMPDGPNRVFLADILSVLAMTMGNTRRCESLRFKLRGSDEAPHLWGHEYVRHLAGEIAREYRTVSLADSAMRDDDDEEEEEEAGEEGAVDASGAKIPTDKTASSVPGFKLARATLTDISRLVKDIIPFLVSSNAEPEAVDLLMEVDALPDLVSHADEHNYARVCLYLKSCTDYISELDDVRQLLKIAADIYLKVDKLPDAMQVALRTNDIDLITSIYKKSAEGSTVRLQLAFDLARAGVLLDEDVESDPDLRAAMSNSKLSAQFLALAKDLDVTEAKTPEDIYKSHLLDSRAPSSSAGVDSARANLAKTFVNAFVNMGFCDDKLMCDNESSWIYRNTDHGMMSAAASVGMVMLWDVDASFNAIDRYLHVEQKYIRAGAYLAFGLVSANVRHEVDPALALLAEHVTSDTPELAHGAICGLGLAYAGTCREEIKDTLSPLLVDETTPSDTVSYIALALGLTYIGSADEDLSSSLLHALSNRKDSDDSTKEPLLHILLPLALGFVYLGHQESCEVILETIDAMVGQDSMIGAIATTTLQACAYCGSGSVLMVQKFLSICGEHPGNQAAEEAADAAAAATGGSAGDAATDSNKAEYTPATGAGASADGVAAGSDSAATPTSGNKSSTAAGTQTGGDNKTGADSPKVRIRTAQQAIAVLGLAMISMGEELGSEMSIRTFGHLLQYGDPVIRRVVPLAIGLLSMSNPKLTLMDMLSKFTHDSDMEVAQTAIIGLGLIGAGTNNSRIAGTLRQLSVYYSKEASSLFLVRIAQGLLHAGKGLVTLNPYYGERFLQSRTAIGGLLTVLFSCLQMKGTILGKHHFLLYFLALAAKPRMVYAVDEKAEFKQVSVRVGQAVDTVGQAGRPKSITGFQTHTTPVLLAAGERAELATEEYLTVAASMEGVVVIEKNPDWVDESGLLDQAVAAAEKADKLEQAASAAASASGAAASAAAASAASGEGEASGSAGGESKTS